MNDLLGRKIREFSGREKTRDFYDSDKFQHMLNQSLRSLRKDGSFHIYLSCKCLDSAKQALALYFHFEMDRCRFLGRLIES